MGREAYQLQLAKKASFFISGTSRFRLLSPSECHIKNIIKLLEGNFCIAGRIQHNGFFSNRR